MKRLLTIFLLIALCLPTNANVSVGTSQRDPDYWWYVWTFIIIIIIIKTNFLNSQ